MPVPALILLALASRAQSSVDPVRPQDLIRLYQSDSGSLDRKYPLPGSASRIQRFKTFNADTLRNLEALPFDNLNDEDRIDYVLFRNYLVHEQRQAEADELKRAESAPLLPFAPALISLLEGRLKLEPIDASKAAAAVASLTQAVNSASAQLDGMKKVKGTVANRAAGTVDQLRYALDRWHDFYDGFDPLFTWWMASPYLELQKSLADYASVLRTKLVGQDSPDAIIGDPIGRAGLVRELEYEMIPYSPEELTAFAEKEFAWCEAEMKKASREMGYGDDWKKAMEHVKELHVAPGEQPKLIRDLAIEATEFVEKHDLVTVPPLAKETWRMEMLSPERQKANPFFLGGEEIEVSFPTNTMTQAEKQMSMRGNNPHFARATVFHELVPGHHLQGFMADRYRPYRSLFYTPFYVEGWALYWELLMWDLNFPRSPEDKVGMLFWHMHRCARIILSLNFHMEKMTPAECIDYLVDRVGHERANATAEVRRWFRGDYGPLYQAGYLLGGLQIRALHHELVDSKKMTDRQFHDAILQQNTVPIEMVRAALTGQRVPKDFRTSWRFFDK
jgi:Bacterial protein of unknown function (DUF885)